MLGLFNAEDTPVEVVVKFGLSDSEWNIFETYALAPLKAQGCRVFVFGSRARGDHAEFSDLDVLIDSQRGLPLGVLGEIRAHLEASDLPIKVDLVEQADLASSFREGVMKERKEV